MTKIRKPKRPTLNHVLRRANLSVALTAVFLAGLSLTVGGLVLLKSVIEHNLELMARSIGYTVEAAVVFEDASAIEQLLEPFVSNEDIAQVSVLNKAGELLTEWKSPHKNLSDNMAIAQHILRPAAVSHPIIYQGNTIGQVIMHGSTKRMVIPLLQGLIVIFACLLVSMLAASVLSRRTLRSIINPLQQLTEVAHAVRYNRAFDKRVPDANIHELHELNQDFNNLLDELVSWQSRLKQENESLSHRATHDSLTGLPNRAFFESRLDRLIKDSSHNKQQLALLYLDSDDFKAVNDTHGHEAGDTVLKAIASRLRAQVREQDMVARLGGDEFVILIGPVQASEHIHRVTNDIHTSMQAPITLADGATLLTSLSIGTAIYPEHGDTREALMKQADAAMYAAKRAGRGSF